MPKSGYSLLFDAICSVLGIYESSASDAKFKGLLSRVSRAIKRGEIDFSYSERGARYIHTNKLKDWSASYINDFILVEEDEKKKLKNHNEQNQNNMERIEIENTADLIIKAEKHTKESEAKKRGAEKSNQKKKKSQEYCIKTASDLWGIDCDDEDDVYKIKEMSQLLLDDLLNYHEMFKPKSLETIKRWLKKAEKNGDLIIPKVAKKPGRPKKQI